VVKNVLVKIVIKSRVGVGDSMKGKSNLHRVFDFIGKYPKAKSLVWKFWYRYLTNLDKKADMTFMNYGYASKRKFPLEKVDESNRYCVQLYDHVASKVNLRNLDVLEVGCGRGGGSSYIMRYMHPKSMTGLDFSENAIEFCKKHYSIKGLSFIAGAAEALPFDSNKFNVVVNIESSHCYANIPKFLGEVSRVLKKKAYFLFADFRNKEYLGILFRQLRNSDFELLEKENITKNILKSLDLDNARKIKIINQKIPIIFRKIFYEFAGIGGSNVYNSFKTGKREYFSFILKNK